MLSVTEQTKQNRCNSVKDRSDLRISALTAKRFGCTVDFFGANESPRHSGPRIGAQVASLRSPNLRSCDSILKQKQHFWRESVKSPGFGDRAPA
jgi:hypothetical protein